MDNTIKEKIHAYPADAKNSLLAIRSLIYLVAKQDKLGPIEECLKWGEPSYIIKTGSTIRIDWKEKTADYCGIYFNCQSKLIETFKQLYPNEFEYQGNRAILLPINKQINEVPLKDCISKALNYHKIKHLPLLGG